MSCDVSCLLSLAAGVQDTIVCGSNGFRWMRADDSKPDRCRADIKTKGDDGMVTSNNVCYYKNLKFQEHRHSKIESIMCVCDQCLMMGRKDKNNKSRANLICSFVACCELNTSNDPRRKLKQIRTCSPSL